MELAEIQNKLEQFNDSRFCFQAGNHSYWYRDHERETELTSATRFVKRFENPFDPTGIILFSCAKRDKILPSDLKQKWNKNGREKAQIGTDCHATIHLFNETGLRFEYSEEQPFHRMKMGAFWRLYDRDLCLLTPISSEIKIFNRSMGIAGTVDRLYHIDGKCCIFDWKTNEKMKNHGGVLKYPFSDLRDTDVNRYSIQLSVYRLILQLAGIETGESFLGWLGNPDGEIIPCLDLTQRLKEFLNV